MSKKAFDKIAAGLNDAIAIARGKANPATYRVHVPGDVDVKAIRKGLGLSQADFALRFGISPGTLRDWEQKRKRPEGPARVLLMIIKEEPQAVERAAKKAGMLERISA
jgi:putative transcriptional regulator